MSARTTRIPVFGRRVGTQQPLTNDHERQASPQHHDATIIIQQQQSPQHRKKSQRKASREDEITAKDLGRKVRVVDKEGVLRFVGNVHFSTGVWCGVELASAVGKNDGVVRGVRYFSCSAACGLMAPLSKVSLIDEIAEDAASGPYSMIFDINNQLVDDRTIILDEAEDLDKTYNSKSRGVPPLIRSKTFEKTFEVNSPSSLPLIRNANNITFTNDQFKATSTTLIQCDSPDTSLNGSGTCNKTVINISITESGRVLNISHSDKEIVNITHSKDNLMFDVKSERKNIPLKETQRHKAPSDLNLRSFVSNEAVILQNVSELSDRPKSYPIADNYFSSVRGARTESIIPHYASLKKERSVRSLSPTNHNIQHDDNSKRDSLDCDESLGILTPDQMVDNLSFFITSRSPSSENIPSITNDINIIMRYQKETDLASPGNVVDSSLKDYSLGVIDVNEVSALLSDRTMNMDLPLDIDDNKKDFTLTRIDQTPSPEDLPLDPTPISVDEGVGSVSETKTEPTQSKTSNNFITSITSITSIDTGYQGDGEMSRPGSRGPDNSPLTRRPLGRPQPRRPDPMTDSDFYTESDADNHEEHPLRGDRRAQVIDGTLYGVDPQAAADIYVNNRENMDSSGIFTDLESNLRTEELSSADNDLKPNQNTDISPSDSSTKTISENSQNNMLINQSSVSAQSPDSKNFSDSTLKESSSKRHTPSPSTATSSPASVRSPRHTNKDENVKKYKTPKRNVTSKVKAMLESNNAQNSEKKPVNKKPVGRWDAVMNKISKNQENSKNVVKEIKSKVFASITTTSTIKIQQNSNASTRSVCNQKSPNSKPRRIRTRTTTSSTPAKINTTSNRQSSIHSSLSDISGVSPIKKSGSAKKQRDVVRVTQVLTPAKFSPKPNNRSTNEFKKAPVPQPNDAKAANRKNLFSSKDKKKENFAKECNRTTTKGGRVSPGTRPPQQQRVPMKAPPKTAEALAVLVQHLVFNLEAFRVPSLKKEVERLQLDFEKTRLNCLQLEDQLSNERQKHSDILGKETARYRTEVTALIEHHRNTIADLNDRHAEVEERLVLQSQDLEKRLVRGHEEQLQNLRQECNRLQRTHAETLDILREENDAIREEIDDKNSTIERLKRCRLDGERLRRDYEMKETSYKEHIQSLQDEIIRLKEENETLLNYSKEGGNDNIQEVHSLRAVLELKLSDVADLRKALAKANEKAEQLPQAEEKVASLTAKCEDLTTQLERKNNIEQQIISEKSKLEVSLVEEINQNKRLKQRNEELQWKVQQNREIFNRICEQAEESGFSRSAISSSFNERILTTSRAAREKTNRTFNGNDGYASLLKRSKNSDSDANDCSPPSSPKVKGVVEKSDSVSYVLEMDESPDVAASRILRRSFRNSTPPKNTPTKSPVNKIGKQKGGNPLSLSASTSAIIPTARGDHMRARSISVRNGDYDEDKHGGQNSFDLFVWEASSSSSSPKSQKDNHSLNNQSCRSCKLDYNIDLDDEHELDIKLPSLPSEMGRRNIQSLPVPRRLAGEAMVSENNSEDESTTSSSSSGNL